jgi:hypothetical protein
MQLLISVIGSVLTLSGLLLMLTPIPGSSVTVAVGVAMLICSSERAARCLRYFRIRLRFLNSGFTWLEDRVPELIGAALRRSRP